MANLTEHLSEDEDGQEGQADGGKLRRKLEKALEDNRKLAERVRTHEVKQVLTEKGFDLVTPDDLSGVDLDEIEAKAAEIQERNQKLQGDLLRKALQAKGFEGEDLDEMVESIAGAKTAEQADEDATKRAQSLGRVDSTTSPRVDPSKLHGIDAISAGIRPVKGI